MVEREVDDAVGACGAFLQAVRIVDRSTIDFGAGGGERRRLLIGSGDADDLMVRGDQFLDEGGTDEPGRAGDEYAHDEVL
jgi:hypothetical protein